MPDDTIKQWKGGHDGNGQVLRNFQFDPLATDPSGSGLYPGRMWYNTVSRQFKYYDGVGIVLVEAGAEAPLSCIMLNFGYGDASPELVGMVPAGKAILSVVLTIITAFNGAAPSLAVGTVDSPTVLMDVTTNDPATVGSYETHPNVQYGSDTTINLTIVPGSGATTGAGVLIVNYQP